MSIPNCPQCDSEYAYEDRNMFVCPMCAYEWSGEVSASDAPVIKDAHGTELNDGDDVTVIKDLKVSGASGSIKRGTKVKSIRLIFDSADGHDIDCKVDGFGPMKLKSEFVKKL
ncbi:MAG: alkylphosphonate utilization protein [Erysipelothrix sp.]|nr:alkylphosphonate utilization protein [Erysipelothrix sp.]